MIIGHGEYWANKFKNMVNVIIEANKFYSKYSDISIPSNRAVRHNIYSHHNSLMLLVAPRKALVVTILSDGIQLLS